MSDPRPSVSDKRRVFHELHRSGCFVIPNPWDPGSARYLQTLGFKALATTSAGFAWSQGLADYGITREAALMHLATMADATELPLNADFQNGFAHEPRGVEHNVRLAIDTGVAGVSIEDASGDAAQPLYDLELATARIRAARRAIDAKGGDTLLVGRAECFLVGRTDIEQTVARLRAYADAGADCLYVPGIRLTEHITRIVESVAPKPVNLLVGFPVSLTVGQIAALGVRRISVGGALARAAWSGFMRSACLLAGEGRFDGLGGTVAGDTLNALLRGASGKPADPGS